MDAISMCKSINIFAIIFIVIILSISCINEESEAVDCSAQFSYTVTQLTDDVAVVQFTPSITNEDAYIWNFGDGGATTEPSPVHTFDIRNERSFLISLVAIDKACRNIETALIDFDSVSIETCEEVNAEFTYKTLSRDQNDITVQFLPINTQADIYDWDFGDGAVSDDIMPEHAFSFQNQKTFSVNLTVSDGPCKGSYSIAMGLTEANEDTSGDNCTANYAFGIVGKTRDAVTVFFAPEELDGEAYAWNFGDGTTSFEKTPTHIFQTAKNSSFSVQLSMDTVKCRATDSQIVVLGDETLGAIPKSPVLTLSSDGKELSLSWTKVDNAEGYILYFGPFPDLSYALSIDLKKNTETRLSFLMGRKGLSFAVKAYNSGGYSDMSNVVVSP